EAEAARIHLHHVRDGFPLGGELRRPLDPVRVRPRRAELERARLLHAAEQPGPDERRPLDPGPEEGAAQRAAAVVREHRAGRPAGERLDVRGQQLRSEGGTGTTRRPARDFGNGFMLTVPATSTAVRTTETVISCLSKQSRQYGVSCSLQAASQPPQLIALPWR